MRKLLLSITPLFLFSLGIRSQVPDLQDIFSPVVVGVPPADAYVGLCVMPDGEWRHYNYGEHPGDWRPLYLSSKDNGKSWQTKFLPRDLPYADQQSPLSGEYIRLFTGNGGVYAMRTVGGLEGGRTITKVDEQLGIMNKPPLFIRNGKRVISAAHRTDRSGAFVYYSDDDGMTWNISQQVNAPKHVKGGFHKGIRWNHGAVEPTIVELNDGKLWMIMRTAQDRHYQSFSTDGGETWSKAEPSPFYGTITMPTLYRIKDGRLLFFWCNTTPLPEMATATGVWDDVLNNREALHAAISDDDGKTWTGFRELLLNPQRNESNYDLTRPGEDKSVHQVQAVEVAPGKILVSSGQHPLCRRLLLFDVGWLYEKGRADDFSNGLENWSAFTYYKGIVGHCSYNRRIQPLLKQHPDKAGRMAMNICFQPNDSLVGDNQGALWNFPAMENGSVTLSVKLPAGAGKVDAILNDRWFNPMDTVARYECMYDLPMERSTLKIKDDKWHRVTIEWKKNEKAVVSVDGKRRMSLPAIDQTQHGISYLHLQSRNKPDDTGVWIEEVIAGK